MLAFVNLGVVLALVDIVLAGRYPKYMIDFVACTDHDCNGPPVMEQHAPWKWITDGQCKSYHRHMFPAFQYRWDGKPNGRACPGCPGTFGHCTIQVFEGIGCTGKLFGQVSDANRMNEDWSPAYYVGASGEEASSVKVTCERAIWDD